MDRLLAALALAVLVAGCSPRRPPTRYTPAAAQRVEIDRVLTMDPELAAAGD